MNKERRLITVDRKIEKDIRTRMHEGFNFSEWVEKSYFEDFLSDEGMQDQIKFHEKMAKNIRNKLDYSAKNRLNLLNKLKKGLNSDERKNTEFSKKILKKHPEKLLARLRCFNNEFKRNLTKEEFLGLMEEEK